jgi:hypothetical protein
MCSNSGNPNNVSFVLPISLHSNAINYSPNASKNNATYKQDDRWFVAHPGRSWVIRKVASGESDELSSIFGLSGSIVFPPQLWMWVTRHPTLGHRVWPVWRGTLPLLFDKDGYLAAESDEVVGLHLDQMATTGGINQADWLVWSAKWNEAKRIYSVQHAVMNQQVQ